MKLFISLILIALFFILTPTAFAQTSTPSSTSKESPSTTLGTSKPTFEVSQTLPTTISPTSPLYTDLLVNNLFHSFSCLAIGQSVIGQPCLTYQITQNAQGMIQGVPVLSSVNLSGGTLGAVTSVIGLLYTNPPVRTADYLASVGQGLGIVKEAKAQGVTGSGAAVLSPILKLWQVSRNISYVILIIIFLIIGLMVMFRNKINPQTVITAQTALPGLVLGLVMITFSYFFAGLISDFAFIGTNLVGYYFQAAQTSSLGTTQSPSNLVNDAKDENVVSIMSRFTDGYDSGEVTKFVETILSKLSLKVQALIRGFAALVAYQYGSMVGTALGAAGGAAACLTGIVSAPLSPVCAAIGSAFGPIVIGSTASIAAMVAPAPIIGQVLWVLVIAMILYTMFKLLLKLVNNYITILFLTLSAPFQFLAAALPGRQGIATGWILNMLANLLAFPAVMAVFYLVAYLLGQGASSGQPFNVGTPLNPAGSGTFPLFGGLDLSILRLLVAFGALMATPAIPDIVGRALGRLNQAGQLIGQEIGGGTRAGQGYVSGVPGRLGGIQTNVTELQQKWRGALFPEGGIRKITQSGRTPKI